MYKDRSIQTNYKLKELIWTVLLSEDDNICLLSGEKVIVLMWLVCASNVAASCPDFDSYKNGCSITG
jgi:hypothetical protein